MIKLQNNEKATLFNIMSKYDNTFPSMITFIRSKDIKDFRPLIDTLIPDFGTAFVYTLLQWCDLANDDEEENFWELWLVKNDNDVIGICGLYSLGTNIDILWLGWLGLIPTERNKGLGKLIMNHLYDESKKVGCKEIYSYVDEAGQPLNFYKREGFEILGTVRDFLSSNNLSHIDGDCFESPDDWVIKKKL